MFLNQDQNKFTFAFSSNTFIQDQRSLQNTTNYPEDIGSDGQIEKKCIGGNHFPQGSNLIVYNIK